MTDGGVASVARDRRLRATVPALLALAAVLVSGRAAALNPDLALTQYSHRAWQADVSENSLPQNSVFSILQARDGFLWLGTQEGLVRFDGVGFTVYNTRNTEQLRHNDVWTLLEDLDGSLWIGTRGGGLTHLKDGVFSNISKAQGLSGDSIQALWQAPDGALWIGTRGNGLDRLKDGVVKVYTTQDGLTNNTVYALRGDRDGGLWIGTDGGGLNRFKDGTFTAVTTKQGLSNDTIYAIREARDGGLWLGTGAGLDLYVDGKLTVYRARDGLSNDNVRSLYLDRDGSLWIGTDGGGVNRFRDGKFSALTTKQGLSNDSIGALYQDREGSLWIGTDAGGLNRIKDNKFVGYSTLEGLSNDNARAVIEDRDGALWIGTFGGLNRYQDGRFTAFTTKDGLSSDAVLSLALGQDGDLWAGTLGGGLNRLHRGKFTHYSKKEGLSNDTVLGLLEDRHGTLWAGTRGGGLNRLDRDGHFKVFTTADGLGSNDVRYILESKNGALWLGTLGGGLTRYQDGKFTTYSKKDGLSNDLVFAIHEDAQGVLWIGTFGGGLNRFKDGKFTAYTTKDGLSDDVVFQVLEDSAGSLWLSSNHGVAQVSKKELDEFADGRIQTLHPVLYGAADGMKSAECNGAHQPAGWKARDGRMWFPTIQGLATVDPQHLPHNDLPPPVVIESFRINDQALTVGERAELAPGRNKVDFDFAALSLLAPEKVQFRYKLEGYDEDWVAGGTRRSVRYTNLPPGSYTFRVLASNNDGVWNEAGATQAFYLRPAFYQRRAFYLVYVLGFGLAVALGMRLQRRRVKQLQARERELMQLMHERQIAADALKSANHALERQVAELANRSQGRQSVEALQGRPTAPAGPQNMDRLIGDFKATLNLLADRERDLQEARDALAREVGEKTLANAEQARTLQRLKMMQTHLVQSEKLASLGALVAGVAHEINTPVGVAVTAASTLRDWAERLAKQYVLGKLTREDFREFTAIATESTEIMLKNLRRSADLIRGFKQVAVDQSSGEQRRFGLKEYLDEILLSLAPHLSRSGHQVTVQCANSVVLNSYPGALAQILTNLVTNSLLHGFPDGRKGRITISVGEEPGGVVLRYNDDGAGIPVENLNRIYDPFFTTRRGSGGSGLGLHIVYNLVTQRLGGTITVSSTVGQGTFFDLRFPLEAPPTAAAS